MLDRHTQARAAAISATEQSAERELKVYIQPHGLNYWEIEGSRAQLEAEGIEFPAGVTWPEGAGQYYWRSGSFRFRLTRALPDGLKGPRRNYPDLDWWCVRCDYNDRLDPDQHAILLKKRELAEAIRLASPDGQREADRAWKAARDVAFQEFKGRIPGLVRPKRGRTSRVASDRVRAEGNGIPDPTSETSEPTGGGE